MFLTIATLVLAVILLASGAECVVRGGTVIAKRLGLSDLLIGLTIVAWGTSAPEFTVAMRGALTSPETMQVSVGNCVGANIYNILMVLGLTAIIFPIAVGPSVIRQEMPFLVAASGTGWLLASDGHLSRIDGVVMLMIFVAFTAWSYRKGVAGPPEPTKDPADATAPVPSIVLALALLVLGPILLYVGSELMLTSLMTIASSLGISAGVAGLIIASAATATPELAASTIAAFRGSSDIAVGNVIGSNVVNLLGILSMVSIIAPLDVPERIARFDLGIMTGVAAMGWLVMALGGRVRRPEGALLVTAYVCYAWWAFTAA